MTASKTTELKIYGFAPSTYTKTALLVAAEAGAKATLLPLEFKKPSHFKLHPYGKMPVLQHGKVQLFETLAIASYIDRVLGGGRLVPASALEQARMLQWLSVAIDYAYEDLVNGLHADTPAATAVTAAAEQLELLDTQLGSSPYFAGAQLTLADLFLFPMVSFALQKLGNPVLERLPALRRWHTSIAQRPSVKKAA